MSDRRQFLQFGGAAAAAALAGLLPAPTKAATTAAGTAVAVRPASPVGSLAELEARSGGRLGVTLWHPASGRRLGHRQDERFPMCSTFKFVLCAAVLGRVDTGALSLDKRVPVHAADLVAHSPGTTRHVGKDMAVRDLCRTTMITSDNAAANLLLRLIGGPPAVTTFLRGHGDEVTRNDRFEPDMNAFAPGDPRDTTSPAAMAGNLQRFVLGDALSAGARQQLADWLIDNETGDQRLRAGIPKGWRVGDKTGSNGKDTTNDIAVLWPAGQGTPWVLASYLQGCPLDDAGRNDVLRQVAVLAARELA